MAIGLVQSFSLAAIVSPYLKSLGRGDFGSKPNIFAIPELECRWVVIYFAARSLGSKKSLHTAIMFNI